MKLVGLACLCIHCCGGKQGLKAITSLKVLALAGDTFVHYSTLFESVFQGPLPLPPLSSFDYQRQRNLNRLLNTRSSELETTFEVFVFLLNHRVKMLSLDPSPPPPD